MNKLKHFFLKTYIGTFISGMGVILGIILGFMFLGYALTNGWAAFALLFVGCSYVAGAAIRDKYKWRKYD